MKHLLSDRTMLNKQRAVCDVTRGGVEMRNEGCLGGQGGLHGGGSI